MSVRIDDEENWIRQSLSRKCGSVPLFGGCIIAVSDFLEAPLANGYYVGLILGNVVPLVILSSKGSVAFITPCVLERDLWIHRTSRHMKPKAFAILQVVAYERGFSGAMAWALHDAVFGELLAHMAHLAAMRNIRRSGDTR